MNKELYLLLFIIFLSIILIGRLFYLSIINHKYYLSLLYKQHYKVYELNPQRGNIYIFDNENKISLTDNIRIFDIFVDPAFVPDKKKFIEIISPYIYKHLCDINGIKKVNKLECIRNIEKFTLTQIYTGEIYLQDEETLVDINEGKEIDFSYQSGLDLIKKRLDDLIKVGYRDYNYLAFVSDQRLLDELKKIDYIKIFNGYYVYIDPKLVKDRKNPDYLIRLFQKYGINLKKSDVLHAINFQLVRYIKLMSDVNPNIAYDLINLKIKYNDEKIKGIPLLHGLGFEQKFKRIYPYGEFASNILGFVDENGEGKYGIEEYFNEFLKGKKGIIEGLSPIGIGSLKEYHYKNKIDGGDIYLSIDFKLQKKIHELMIKYINEFRADNISIIVMDPYSGKIRGLGSYPLFDPNNPREVYKVEKLKDDIIWQNDTFIDIPVLIYTGGILRFATYEERKNPELEKYIFKNKFGPSVFLDKNISQAIEPGSVFKTVTLAIGIDTDSINIYENYYDPGEIKVGPFIISNVFKECIGNHPFYHALNYSCNVGMTRIAQRVGKVLFYNYLNKLGLGKITNIELAREVPGSIDFYNNSLSRFFNNSFGQGFLATPIQLAVIYSAMVNGGYIVKPTVVEKIYDRSNNQFIYNKTKIIDRVFKNETSKYIIEALWKVVNEGDLKRLLYFEDYRLGGKTGTAQIAYRGTYMAGAGWTNGGIAGIVTVDNLKYVVVVYVRRPRSCQWGSCTALKIFKDIALYLKNDLLTYK